MGESDKKGPIRSEPREALGLLFPAPALLPPETERIDVEIRTAVENSVMDTGARAINSGQKRDRWNDIARLWNLRADGEWR